MIFRGLHTVISGSPITEGRGGDNANETERSTSPVTANKIKNRGNPQTDTF